MAIITFNQYLDEVGGAASDLRAARDRLAGLLSRHNSAALSGLVAGDFAGRPVTKAQYDALMVSANDLVNTWWVAGHGTNIEAYLTERPG
jgi:hypothetical protein